MFREEAASQIRLRSDRLNLKNDGIEILCTNRLEDIENALNALNPVCVIVDSIQTVFSPEAGAVPGTINQLKYCAAELTLWVKERDAVLFMSAHVTKDGSIAGPKALEHLVDTVISFEQNDDRVRFCARLKTDSDLWMNWEFFNDRKGAVPGRGSFNDVYRAQNGIHSGGNGCCSRF